MPGATAITRRRRLLSAIACVGLIPIAAVASFWFARIVLLRVSDDPSPDIDPPIFPVARPVILTGSPGADVYGIGKAMGAPPLAPRASAELLIPIADVERVNPHPPLATSQPFQASFGYIGRDDAYHQITFYMGEGTSTPSPLLRAASAGGDLNVCYTVYMSRMGGDRAIRVDKVNWTTWAGGDYEALDEIGFVMAATPIELAMLVLIPYLFRRSRRSNAVGPPTAH